MKKHSEPRTGVVFPVTSPERRYPDWHNYLLDLHGSGVMGPKFLIVFVIMTMINTVVWQYAAAGL